MSREGEFKHSRVIYTYDLSQLDNVQKVRFVYLLKGRKDGEGLIKELNGYFLVNGCFILPLEKAKDIEVVFKAWQVPFTKEEVLMR